MKKSIFTALLFIGALTACSDDDDNTVNLESVNVFVCQNEARTPNIYEYPETHFSQIGLSEIRTGDAQPVTTTQIYDYETGRVTKITSKQSFMAGEFVEMESIAQVVYEDHKAIVTDDYGYTSTYTLNNNGYAISCVRQEGNYKRYYTFSYLISADGRHFLKNITESLDGSKPYSAINIDYNSYKELHITELTDSHEQSYTATASSHNEMANASEIPFRFLTELYPLSFHTAAIYGKLLGDPYNVLVTQLQPDENSESNETTTYNYKFGANNMVTSCEEVTNSYGEDYVRTVNYTMK